MPEIVATEIALHIEQIGADSQLIVIMWIVVRYDNEALRFRDA